MDKVHTLNVYTTENVLEFDVIESADNFVETLANSIGQGTVITDTVEGSKLILNALNVVAIEIIEKQYPPVEN